MSSKRAFVKGQVVRIVFPYNIDDLNNVKTIPNRAYINEGRLKYWTCPVSIDAAKSLKEFGFSLDDKLENMLSDYNVAEVYNSLPEIEVPGIKRKLFSFQQKGVAYMDLRKGRSLLADEMGLGKTIQALAYLQLHPEVRPAIIVCPASLKMNWKRETRRWLSPIPIIRIIEGRKIYVIDKHVNIIIINYDILQSWVKSLKKLKPKIIITDECHLYKNKKALRTKAVQLLAKDVQKFIAISGTPIVSRPIEIYNAVSIINPNLFPSYWGFAKRYCDAKYTGFGWDFKGATHMEELHSILSESIMIRRTKKEVLKDLPEKIRSFVPMEMDNWDEYMSAKHDFINFVGKTKGQEAADRISNAEQLSQIEALKQIAVRGKLKQAIAWIKNFLESGDKLVIFAVHKFVIQILMDAFPNIAVKIDGSVQNTIRNPERDKNVRDFQSKPNIKLIVGNIQAMGVGFTLTAASHVVFLELPWTPGELSQAIDRLHRIGQRRLVNIWFLLANDTIEEDIARLLDKKLEVVNKILDGVDVEEESMLSSLMSIYNEKK